MDLAALGVASRETVAKAVEAIGKLPKALASTTLFVDNAAQLAPRAIPILEDLLPLLRAAPQLAPLLSQLSSSVAKVMQKAPQYAPLVQQVIDTLKKAPSIASDLNTALKFLADIAGDPALPAIVLKIQEILAVEEQIDAAKKAPSSSRASRAAGIGLGKLLPWLDRYRWVRQHRWVMYAAPVGAVLLVGSVGYALGRASKR